MAIKQRTSLRKRMLFSIGGAVVVAFIITVAFVTIKTTNVVREDSLDIARQTANTESAKLVGEIFKAASISRTLAATMGGISETEKSIHRDAVNDIMRRTLKDNPFIMGVWVVSEPNALDGKDDNYKGVLGNDAAGRFIPYWNRVGGIHLENCGDDDLFDDSPSYYKTPFTTGKEIMLSPYVYNIAGKDIMVVSYCVPIFKSGKVIGVAGVDFSMERFQELVSAISPCEGGYGFLVSSDGKIISYPDNSVIGKQIGDVLPKSTIMQQLKNSETYSEKGMSATSGDSAFFIGEPVDFGDQDPWLLSVVTPKDYILSKSVHIRNVCILIGVISCIVVMILVWIVATKISRPLAKIAAAMSQFSNQLSSSASQVSSSGDSMAQGASESAASIEETSSSMEEITSMVVRNAENSGLANELVGETVSLVSGTMENMKTLMESMQQIDASSKETQRIIKTIDEIAFQTNILALNAAVEAARAGEAGAGFAVVADEVRNLALRSAEAARDTSSMIAGSVSKIDSATHMTIKTEADFRKVDESSQKITSFIGEIAQASNEQKTGVSEVGKAIDELSIVVQKNAAVAEESAAAAQEMNALSEQLRVYAGSLSSLIGGNQSIGDFPTGSASDLTLLD